MFKTSNSELQYLTVAQRTQHFLKANQYSVTLSVVTSSTKTRLYIFFFSVWKNKDNIHI